MENRNPSPQRIAFLALTKKEAKMNELGESYQNLVDPPSNSAQLSTFNEKPQIPSV
jgi:hypothetical protein